MTHQILISLPMMVCLFWGIYFLIRLFRPEPERRVTATLVLFYAAATVLYLDHWLYFSGIVRVWGEWSYGIVNLLVYPLYYTYLRALTRANRGGRELIALFSFALPGVVLFPIGRYTALLSDAQTFLIIRLCFALQVVWVLVRGYQLLRHTIRRMDNTYSDDRSRLLRPTHNLLILFGITSAVSMILNVLGREFFTHEASVSLPAVVMSVLLYGLGFVAAHTTLPAETVNEETAGESLPATDKEETSELIRRIDTIMREQLLYTNAGLTIQDLAVAVGSNRTYVSNAINRTYHISFSQYVSRQRIAYAQLILKDPRYRTDKAAVSDAISLSGFASDQTFYRVFKDLTGQTPLQYRKANG
ncbi:MAG: helix-turn-helix transcriptional regulator [Paludibacteraceae bacterium]|nr:helix-turn-helix transcriptional regulator [Paludibacteraceae bacterium]